MNRGVRLGPNPHPVGVSRGNWEFLGVVRGNIRPIFSGDTKACFQNRRLWLFPPESTHSWNTPAGKSCDVCVFHFASIHPLLESSLPADRRLSMSIDDEGVHLLETLYRELLPHYRAPRLSSPLHFEAAMLRLCGHFLGHAGEVCSLPVVDGEGEMILRAVQWHRAHLGSGVRVNDVAAALKISPCHLRRLFLRVRGESPKRVFMRTTIEEACRLMAQSRLNLKQVSARCGFCGFSEFYRAFKQYTRQSPSMWRSNQLYRGLGIVTSAPKFGVPNITELNQTYSSHTPLNSPARAV
jgi:AraC family transcriptional regulator